jgi:hypothetical protein
MKNNDEHWAHINRKPERALLPKTIRDILERYGVIFRDRNSKVVHRIYGTKTFCSPTQFAVFEAAIKAQYVANMIYCALSQPDMLLNVKADFDDLARRNKIQLTEIDTKNIDWAKSKSAAEDYHICKKWIIDMGLYRQLLD